MNDSGTRTVRQIGGAMSTSVTRITTRRGGDCTDYIYFCIFLSPMLEHRVFYVATFAEGIYVLHAFEKKTQRTRQADIEIGKDCLRAVRTARREAATRTKKGRH